MLVKLSSVLLGPIIAIANAWFVFNAVNVMTPSTEVGILHSIKNDKNDHIEDDQGWNGNVEK
eukprot:m.66312 g.66312  ORF g.66312 m.66312 type:complete len:62 (-) comp11796_c0_seq1:2363-2548(-)